MIKTRRTRSLNEDFTMMPRFWLRISPRPSRPAPVALLMIFGTAVLAGCTQLVTGTAHSEPMPITQFPNLDDFTAVSSDDYKKTEHWGDTIYFATPSGIRCTLSAYFTMSCNNVNFALLPGSEPAGGPTGCKGVEPTSTPSRERDNTYRFFHTPDPCSTGDQDLFKPLAEESKVSLEAHGSLVFTCAVRGPNIVACIDDQDPHGFVLQPDHSWTF